MPKKPKTQRAQDSATSRNDDRCYTPPYALEPLYIYLQQLEQRLGRPITIWEPFAGAGDLANTLRARGYTVIASELVDEQRDGVIGGKNAFNWRPDEQIDVIVSNPPYSIKELVYKWLGTLGLPFAILVPVESIALTKLHPLFKRIRHEQLLLDSRVDFKMPSHTTWLEGSAQFPVMWSCAGLLGAPVIYGEIKAAKREFRRQQKELASGVEQFLLEFGELVSTIDDETDRAGAPDELELELQYLAA